MKKILIILFLLMIVCAFKVNAQNSLEIKSGLMLNPQFTLVTPSTNRGIGCEFPVFATMSFEKNRWTVTPVFGVAIIWNTEKGTIKTTNLFGGFLKREIDKEIGLSLYLVGLKDIREDSYVVGIGAELPIPRFANIFLEIGREYRNDEWGPKIALGVSIPIIFHTFHWKINGVN